MADADMWRAMSSMVFVLSKLLLCRDKWLLLLLSECQLFLYLIQRLIWSSLTRKSSQNLLLSGTQLTFILVWILQFLVVLALNTLFYPSYSLLSLISCLTTWTTVDCMAWSSGCTTWAFRRCSFFLKLFLAVMTYMALALTMILPPIILA